MPRRNLILMVVVGSLLSGGTSALAQSLTEGQIAVIQPRPVLVKHRLEVMPRFGATFNDPLISQFHLGGSAYYHISERIHVGATFEWYDFGDFGGPTEAYDNLIRASSTIPEIAPLTYFTSLDVGWVPINGKFALFDALIVYFDYYGVLGAGVVDSVGDPHPALTLAIGQRIFITDWLALLVELRDRAYFEPLPVAGDTLTNILSTSIGFSFFLPPDFEYSDQPERILDWE